MKNIFISNSMNNVDGDDETIINNYYFFNCDFYINLKNFIFC